MKEAYDTLEQSFYEDVYKEQVRLRNKKIKHVGSCALTLLLHKNRVYVANSGDSQAIIIKNASNTVDFVKLNSKLSTNNPKERRRLYE